MINAVSAAAKHFCTDIMGYELQAATHLGKDIYGATIPVYRGKDEYIFYLYFKEETLKVFSEFFFNTKEAANTDLADLNREVANQIIGFAKNLLNEAHPNEFHLGTPEFLGKVAHFPVRLHESRVFKMKNRTFKIGYKKL